ncbi:hypothetical protein [Sphaerotilus mobilis]|uniref:hypothetical protein n=1 Tax=Sphaerotilus mobilis TaxID=47994 RepID=UPI00102CB9FF|nr:hypothetical protein [Sphaerotilus mobilis]
MTSALLFLAVCLLLVAVPLLVYILVSKRTVNIQAVWEFAVAGHRPSRWYVGIIVLAFSLAVASVICSRFESQTGSASVSSSNEMPPNPAFQRTAYGGR